MRKETKHDRFQRIVQARKQNVLECLQSLGNCSNPASYAYEIRELPPHLSGYHREACRGLAPNEHPQPLFLHSFPDGGKKHI